MTTEDRDMTPEDRHAACGALISWFQSQEIKPGDAGCIMLAVMATQIVHRHGSNPDKLLTAIKHMSMLLAAEMAEAIHAGTTPR